MSVSGEVNVKRVAAVQEGIGKYGWSIATLDRLAEELNVSQRTVRRCWSRAVAMTRRSLDPSNVEKMRVRQVMRLESNIAEAARTGDFSAAMRGEQVYAQLTGTIAPTNVNVNHAVTVIPPAVSARLSGLSTDELRQIATQGREVVDVEAVPVLAVAGDDNGR